MMRPLRHSISRKFMLAVLGTTCIALLVFASAMTVLDVRTFKTTWVGAVTVQANTLAQVNLPALEFNDRKAAAENLKQLQSSINIVAAAIYAADGSLFASFAKEGAEPMALPARPQANGFSIDGGEIKMFRQVSRNGEQFGTVFVAARYPLAERVQRYIFILAAVLGGSLIVAALVSFWVQAGVTQPVLALTQAVNQVVRQRDFSQKVRKSTDDEVGILVDAFNIMLTEVGERTQALVLANSALQHEVQERLATEEALQQLNNTLEERVAKRTQELSGAHEQLRQSQKMEAIGQLTGGVAHDFNNVLQVIVANLQMLKMNFAGNDQAQRRLDAATSATERGAKLASQLLSFARRQPLQPLPTNLGRVLRGMDDLLRRSLGESIQIETIVAGGLWNTLVDQPVESVGYR